MPFLDPSSIPSVSYVLVTGASGHIGFRTCEELAANGYSLILLDRDPILLESQCKEIQKNYSVDCRPLQLDLLDIPSFKELPRLLSFSKGHIVGIVNNAAFYDTLDGWGVPFLQEGYQAWMSVLSVNLMAPFFLIQTLVPYLSKSHFSIVNVSSIYANVAPDSSLYQGTDMTNEAAYTASKGGLASLTRWLASELSPIGRVNTVTPGGVFRNQPSLFVDRYVSKTLLNRMASESDIAKAIYFLISDQSSYITGQDIVVDGGYTIT